MIDAGSEVTADRHAYRHVVRADIQVLVHFGGNLRGVLPNGRVHEDDQELVGAK